MRRHFIANFRQSDDTLPLKISSRLKQTFKSPRRKKSTVCSVISNNTKRKCSKETVYFVIINTYLVLLGIFTLYHADSIRVAVFTKRDSLLNRSKTEMGVGGAIRDRFIEQTVTPLRFPLDYEKFTVRINTWKREEQLKLSIQHFMTCSGVGQIQVVWCLNQGEPPKWLLEMEHESYKFYINDGVDNLNNTSINKHMHQLLVIERHLNNSLNERFLEIEPIPTAGVLSVDDDVIRPCLAIHSAFVKWTLNPDRQVGFDARSHTTEALYINNANNRNDSAVLKTAEKWSYQYMSTTEKANKYSITLTRFSFQHRDYLRSYWVEMPQSVRDIVAHNFNCEDIAMSLWISSKTEGKPPLLADYWAVKSQIKMFVPTKISGTTEHKPIRDYCFDKFSTLFQLKGRLHTAALHHNHNHRIDFYGFFDYGDEADDWNKPAQMPQIQIDTLEIIDRWKKNKKRSFFLGELQNLVKVASLHIYKQGLLEKTQPWKDRFTKSGL